MSTNFQRLGKYELQQRLGRGGMGEVWKAYDLQLHRYVAIKLLHADLQNDPQFITRFEREAQLIASLNHPNIVQVHDFQISRNTGSVNGSTTIAYMVMDYIEGSTLADYISSTSFAGRCPSASEILHLFTSMARAIDYAHQQGMIHRDIKPANILLDKHNTSLNVMGEPILTDFGIAKLLGTSTGSSSGLWHGTELYISPEQAQGYVGNERSDLYALGIILYEICTGAFPFQGSNPTEIMMQHINKQPLAPDLVNPQISPALTAIILRSIAKDPANRFSSASAMSAALAEAFDLPVPEKLDLSVFPDDVASEPTLYKPLPSDIQLVKTSTPPPESVATLLSRASISGAASMGNIPSSSTVLEAGTSALATTPSSTATLVSSQPRRKRRRGLFITLLLLILVLIGSGLVGFFLFSHGKQFTGHAYFVSSLSGADDELLIDLHNVPNPSSGKSYYGWLLSDKSQHSVLSIFLGVLPVSNGAVHMTYQNAQNTNLLGITSRFLVTEEDANSRPHSPSSDQQTWRYYAELSQAPNPGNHLSMLDVLRNLLVNDPTSKEAGLGGLNSWLFKNTGKILEFAGTARDYYGDPTSSDLCGSISSVSSFCLMAKQVLRWTYRRAYLHLP